MPDPTKIRKALGAQRELFDALKDDDTARKLEEGFDGTVRIADKLNDVLGDMRGAIDKDSDSAADFAKKLDSVQNELKGITEAAKGATGHLDNVGNTITKSGRAAKKTTAGNEGYLDSLKGMGWETLILVGLQRILNMTFEAQYQAAQDVISLGLPMHQRDVTAALNEQQKGWNDLANSMGVYSTQVLPLSKTWGMAAEEMTGYLRQLQVVMRITGATMKEDIGSVAEAALTTSTIMNYDLPKATEFASRQIWRFGKGSKDVWKVEHQLVGLTKEYETLQDELKKAGLDTMFPEDMADIVFEIANNTDAWSVSLKALGRTHRTIFKRLNDETGNYNASIDATGKLMKQLDKPPPWMEVEGGMALVKAYEDDPKAFLAMMAREGLDVAFIDKLMKSDQKREEKAMILMGIAGQVPEALAIQLERYADLLAPEALASSVQALMGDAGFDMTQAYMVGELLSQKGSREELVQAIRDAQGDMGPEGKGAALKVSEAEKKTAQDLRGQANKDLVAQVSKLLGLEAPDLAEMFKGLGETLTTFADTMKIVGESLKDVTVAIKEILKELGIEDTKDIADEWKDIGKTAYFDVEETIDKGGVEAALIKYNPVSAGVAGVEYMMEVHAIEKEALKNIQGAADSEARRLDKARWGGADPLGMRRMEKFVQGKTTPEVRSLAGLDTAPIYQAALDKSREKSRFWNVPTYAGLAADRRQEVEGASQRTRSIMRKKGGGIPTLQGKIVDKGGKISLELEGLWEALTNFQVAYQKIKTEK